MSARVSPAAADEIEQIDEVKLKPVAINMDRSAPLITLSWENINVYNPATSGVNLPCYKSPGIPEKHIVKNACGIVKPGTLTAIMGASGAGKTTLLNVLNFRNRGQLRINGDVKINGSVVESREALASLSGYVQQEDLYIGTLKVKEQLKFQAFLRMDNSATDDDRNKRVEDIMHDLNLKKCEDTIIGSPEKGLKGISGGERRRLAFACEMITNPNLMFFDEPTSGLDSFMALSMVESMRKLAKEGKTIICTIHQPSSEVFEKFDRLLLMAEGRLAYLGPLKDANTFFASQGFACPRNYNPADFYIQNLAMVVANREASLERINKICDGFQQSAQMKALEGDLKAADALASNPATAIKLINRMDYKVSFVSQFIWVLWREMLASSRDKFATQFAIFQTFLIALIIGLTFLQLSYDQAGVQNLNGVIFLMLINTSMNAMFNTVNTFPAQIPIFMREHQNGLYSVIVYYLSKFIIDLPKHIILPFITVTIVYWMANCYYDVGHFFLAAVIVIYTVNVAVAFGTFLSAVAPSANAALAMNAPLIVPLMIFSGFFLNNSSVPKYLIWCRYLSWWNYAFELLSVNQWQDVTTISCNAASASSCYNNGADVLTSMDMHSDHIGINWMALSVIFVGWRVLAFVVLFIKSFRK